MCRPALILCLTASLLVSGCGWLRSSQPVVPQTEDKPPPITWTGRIASVPGGQDFVLIQRLQGEPLASGTIVISRGPDHRSANLRLTGEQLGSYAAADIQSGDVEVGDMVLRHALDTPEENP